MQRIQPLPSLGQQCSALHDHLKALTDVLSAIRFSFSERSLVGNRASEEAFELSFMVDAFHGELAKLFEPMHFGSVVEERPVYEKICHVQGLVYLIGDGLSSVASAPSPETPRSLDRAGCGRLLNLLVVALNSLCELIEWKLK